MKDLHRYPDTAHLHVRETERDNKAKARKDHGKGANTKEAEKDARKKECKEAFSCHNLSHQPEFFFW